MANRSGLPLNQMNLKAIGAMQENHHKTNVSLPQYPRDFVSGQRPKWKACFTENVKPFEIMKLRMLNGSHTALCYSAYLLGHRYVKAAVDDPLIGCFLQEFIAEQRSTLDPVPGIDLEDYEKSILVRFSNNFIQDDLLRLSEDGSLKFLTTMRDAALMNASSGRPIRGFATAVALWIRFLLGFDESGEPIAIKDPRGEDLTKLACGVLRNLEVPTKFSHPNTAAVVAFMRFSFGDHIAENNLIIEAVLNALIVLTTSATRGLLEIYDAGK